jgi:hypothetical protein
MPNLDDVLQLLVADLWLWKQQLAALLLAFFRKY